MKYKGLTEQEVNSNRKSFGRNEVGGKTKNPIWGILIEIFKEPLFIILIAASIIYFILGEATHNFGSFVAIGFWLGVYFDFYADTCHFS